MNEEYSSEPNLDKKKYTSLDQPIQTTETKTTEDKCKADPDNNLPNEKTNLRNGHTLMDLVETLP
ncbi:hypothetical protein CHS0354_027990, partial [Potamilus streckersoni]